MDELSGNSPAVDDIKQFKRFLRSPYRHCVLINAHINLLQYFFDSAAEADKRLCVHIDLTRGLANDPAGVEFLADRFKPAALLSIKPAVIAAAKRLKTPAIQRIFLIDSAALRKSVASVEQTAPDYVEILPGLCSELFSSLREVIKPPMITGGLIQSLEQAERILGTSGVVGVTISMARIETD